jgi:putative hydrolase of the HAD superfamily
MSEREPLEAVLFDAGGTLVRLDFEWMTETLREVGVNATVESLRRAEITGRRCYDTSRSGTEPGTPTPLGGRGDTDAYFGGMVEALGAKQEQIEAALERFYPRLQDRGLWTCPMEGARGVIDALGKRGLRLAVVSNSDGRAARHLADSGVLDGIEFVVDSHVVGIEKPEPGIFTIALARLDVEPSRTLFVGDIRSVDENGAAAAGTHFVLIDPYGDYAPPGAAAIASIAELPAWIESHFEIAASGDADARRAGGRGSGT